MKRLLVACLVLCGSLFAAEQPRPVTLTWQDNAGNEVGFEVQRSTAVTGGFVTLSATVAPNAEMFIDPAPIAGATNRYRVRAWNLVGESEWAGPVSMDIPALETAPNAPTAPALETPGRLVNISTRGLVEIRDQILIAGFVVSDGPAKVLIRAVGPRLAQSPFNLPRTLANPRLALLRGQTQIAANDDWSGDDIAAAAAQVSAFPLTAGSHDAAILTTLPPGQYTIHVAGPAGETGVALVEVYLVP